MIAARTDDGRFGPPGSLGTAPGDWRPAPPGVRQRPERLAQRSRSRSCWRARRSSGRKGPNALTSRRYAREYNEVKTLGAATRSVAHRRARRLPPSTGQTNLRHGTARSARSRRAGAHAGRAGPALCDAEPDRGRCPDQLLERQGILELLAADHGDPGGRRDGNPQTTADPAGAVDPHAPVLGTHFGVQLRQGLMSRAAAVLRKKGRTLSMRMAAAPRARHAPHGRVEDVVGARDLRAPLPDRGRAG